MVLTAVTPEVSRKYKEKALKALGELPPFSPVLSRLLATLAREDASYGKLGELIESDTVVAGNVLHLVNSAAYARQTRITSVRHAISVLGMNKLRNAVLGMSVARLWKSVTMPAGWSTAQFNRHSAATAIMSDLLVQHLDADYPEGAFIAGLLHDIGHMLLAWSLSAEYTEVMRRNAAGDPWEDCERGVLGFTHAELSGSALAIWKLPEPVQAAVAGHHSPHASAALTLARILDGADRWATSAGFAIHPLTETAPDKAVLLKLGVPEKLGDALAASFETECKAVMQFLE
jgi:HD-like signal output (HDOD) protein